MQELRKPFLSLYGMGMREDIYRMKQDYLIIYRCVDLEMDCDSYAACAVFLRLSEGLKRTNKPHGGILGMFEYQHLPQLARSRHPIPVTVGTFEIAKS